MFRSCSYFNSHMETSLFGDFSLNGGHEHSNNSSDQANPLLFLCSAIIAPSLCVYQWDKEYVDFPS